MPRVSFYELVSWVANEFSIPKEFHEVEYKVYPFSMLPKTIPQVLCARVFILQSFKTRDQVFSNKGSIMQEQNQIYLRIYIFIFCIYLIGSWIIVDFYSDRD